MIAPYFSDGLVELHLGNCLDVLPSLPDNSVDAVITDGPYGLAELSTTTVLQAIAAWMAGDRNHVPDGKGFMGQEWDRFVPPPGVWDQCLRVLKPGGHLLSFAASRTQDLMGLSIRIAGFEMRDGINWIYGNGFPKSHDVSKAIDRIHGAAREIIGVKPGHEQFAGRATNGDRIAGAGHEGWSRPWADGEGAESYHLATAPATPEAARWEGWGTAIKPAHEPIVVARKPFAGTVGANVLAHGTGALNIDACRTNADRDYFNKCASVVGLDFNRNGATLGTWSGVRKDSASELGRWPTNVVFSHSLSCGESCTAECPVADLGQQSGSSVSRSGPPRSAKQGSGWRMTHSGTEYNDSGNASRFFPVFRYEAKAPASERPRLDDGTVHTTVKPLELLRWLVRLVTPPGGTVLDPFVGSGTTLEACTIEGFHAIGIEKEQPYADLCVKRLSKPIQPVLGFEEAS